jgi:hypothetical protein
MPTFAMDLHLDEVLAPLCRGTAEEQVAARFLTPLRDPDAVAFRHEIFRELESLPLRDALAGFVARMHLVDEQLAHAAAIVHAPERHRWQLDAADVYRTAVAAAAEALDRASPSSRGLAAVTANLREYVASDAFIELGADTTRMLADLAKVTYRLRIVENRVTVGRHDGEADYGAEVLETFARFRRSDAAAPLEADVFSTIDMNPVEIEILRRVARLHRPAFQALEAWAGRHRAFLEPAVAAFAEELGFYLGWLERIAPLRDAGLPFCYPEVSEAEAGLSARGVFDLALALRRTPPGDGIVTNDVELSGGERLLVITGPNQGGKTSFARAIGQLHHLASIGVPVPGSTARVALGATAHTLFARAEDPADLTGRLEAELRRAAAIVDALRPGSVVIMNESFASTTSEDALVLNRALIAEMLGRGATCVVVTFLAELATDDPSTASMTAVADPLDPTIPTFRLQRRPPDPLAHARAIADLHGLGYDAVRERIAERPAP